MIRPTYSQTETTLLSALNVSVARICCLSQISLVKKASGFRDISSRYIMKCAVDIRKVVRACRVTTVRACGARDEGIDRFVSSTMSFKVFASQRVVRQCRVVLSFFFSACFSVVSSGDTTMFHVFFLVTEPTFLVPIVYHCIKNQMCSFLWADNFCFMSHSKIHLEQMLRDLIQEAEMWTFHPKPASRWWTSTYDPEEKTDLSIDTKSGRHGFLFEEKNQDPRMYMNRQRKAHEGIEERMQSANKAWWKDVKLDRSKDVPWRVKCRGMVEHVNSILFLK